MGQQKNVLEIVEITQNETMYILYHLKIKNIKNIGE